jgi:L-alanine-DL-glutamate epimerase-like enolase superfamily enzyme
MLEAGAVDVLQADATRCLGISGFMRTPKGMPPNYVAMVGPTRGEVLC